MTNAKLTKDERDKLRQVMNEAVLYLGSYISGWTTRHMCSKAIYNIQRTLMNDDLMTNEDESND